MPPSSSSSCLIIGARKKEIPVSRANKEAFSQLPGNSLNDIPVDGRSRMDVVNTWIQSSAGGTSPRAPFADNPDVVVDENPKGVDIRIVEEARLGGPKQPSLPQIGNCEDAPTRVGVATPSAGGGDPGTVQNPVQPDSRPKISKREAAKLRGVALLEIFANYSASSADLRPHSTAPTSGLGPEEALTTNATATATATDYHNVLQPPPPIQRLESSMEDNTQRQRTGRVPPQPSSQTSAVNIHTFLPSNTPPSLESNLQNLLGRVSETESFLAQRNMPGRLQEMGSYQGGGDRGSMGGSIGMLPINGTGNPFKQTEPFGAQRKHAHHGGKEENKSAGFGGSASMTPRGNLYMQNPQQREPPRAQGTSNMQTQAAWEPSRAQANEYISQSYRNAPVHETSKATANSPPIMSMRDASKDAANLYNAQNIPTRRSSRREGGSSHVRNPVLHDAPKVVGSGGMGKFISEKDSGQKGFNAVQDEPSLLRNTSTSRWTAPFAVVIQSPRHIKTSSEPKQYSSSTHFNPEPNSADEAPALSTIGQDRTGSFRVEISSSPALSRHRSPPLATSTNPMSKKRGRRFASSESATKATEKADGEVLQASGDQRVKKRGRPFATVDAVEKAAKKLKSTGADGELPKKRGRHFALDKLIEGPEPYFPIFYCEWKGCPAELHNLDTLRKHLHVLHKQRDKSTGGIPCMFRKCADSHAETNAINIEGQASHAVEGSAHPHPSPVVFKKRSDWKEHLEKEHLIPIAWHLGDGPQVETFSPKTAEYDLRKNEPWLFNSEGVQVIESVRGQRIEHGRASVNNSQRYKKKLRRELHQAKRESMLAARKGTHSMTTQNDDKRPTGFSVVIPSKPHAADEYRKVDMGGRKDELALDNLGYDAVFDEEDEKRTEVNDGDEMLV